MARSALINNPRYNPSRNGVQTKKNDPSERTERVIFVFAAVFLRPAGGFVERLEQFRETLVEAFTKPLDQLYQVRGYTPVTPGSASGYTTHDH